MSSPTQLNLAARQPYPKLNHYDSLVMSAPLDRRGAKNVLGGNMARHLAFGGAERSGAHSASSLACLAFVLLLGVAFWAGAVWIGQFLLRLGALTW